MLITVQTHGGHSHDRFAILPTIERLEIGVATPSDPRSGTNLEPSMQTTIPTNERVRALAVQATELKQTSDHCSGETQSWSELNLDNFARMIVEECVGVIEQHRPRADQRVTDFEALKMALRAKFGTS